MHKLLTEKKLQPVIFKANKSYIAYSMVLEHASSGDTFEEAKKNLLESAELLLEELAEWNQAEYLQILRRLK